MGQFVRMRTFPTAAYLDVPGANTDTLYTMVWLDVSKEPWIFSIPDTGDRYYMAPRFVTNPDGSVDLYLQAASPGKAKEANWLPAPRAKFGVMLRLYWPTDTPPTIIDASWKPPAIQAAAPVAAVDRAPNSSIRYSLSSRDKFTSSSDGSPGAGEAVGLDAMVRR